jgi:hypothetical protein
MPDAGMMGAVLRAAARDNERRRKVVPAMSEKKMTAKEALEYMGTYTHEVLTKDKATEIAEALGAGDAVSVRAFDDQPDDPMGFHLGVGAEFLTRPFSGVREKNLYRKTAGRIYEALAHEAVGALAGDPSESAIERYNWYLKMADTYEQGVPYIEGVSMFDLAFSICHNLGVTPEGSLGRGTAVRNCVEAIRNHLGGE